MNSHERRALEILVDALARLDDPATARAGIAKAVCCLAGAEGGVLLLGRKFANPALGDAPDADYGPVRAKADLVLEMLPTFGPTNPIIPILGKLDQAVFAVPEVVGRRAWVESPYYREFLGAVMDTHAVLGVSFGMAGGMWLGHPDRKRFSKSVQRKVETVVRGIGRGLANLDRYAAALAGVRSANGVDPDAARAAGLTGREVDVLSLLARGLSHKQVAAELGISYFTVTTHARNLFAKLKVNGRIEALNAVGRGPRPHSHPPSASRVKD